MERLRLRRAAWRAARKAREALCAHDGTDPMCRDCAAFYNPV